jgi:hypothetical protein
MSIAAGPAAFSFTSPKRACKKYTAKVDRLNAPTR